MAKSTKTKMPAGPGPVAAVTEPITLATLLAALERPCGLSATRCRDLSSGVNRVAVLLGDEPSAIPLDMEAISARLSAIRPIAVGLTPKRLANIRSDFLAAVRASGLALVIGKAKNALSPGWARLMQRLPPRRPRIGLSRFAHYASSRGVEPGEVDETLLVDFVAEFREKSLVASVKALHRRTARLWNEAARDPRLGLQPVPIPSYRQAPTRIDLGRLPESFRNDAEAYLEWAGNTDPFAAGSRPRPLAPLTCRLRRVQIHAAVTALVESGISPVEISSLADLVTPENFKRILRRRLQSVGDQENAFNSDLARSLFQIAYEWVRLDAKGLDELKRLTAKMPGRSVGLTPKNKRFLRQFDDPRVLVRLAQLPEKLWGEVKRDSRFSQRTLAKAQAALAIAIPTYLPIRLRNLSDLGFDTHLFIRSAPGAISTLELPSSEVKNKTDLTYDIPPHLAKMLLEYRDRIAPRIIGQRPARLFVNIDGTPKSSATVAWLITTYTKKRAGIVLTPHQFRHLSAKLLLDDQPGGFETVRQLLGHRNSQTTVNAYAGIDSRRAARHHHRLIEKAITPQVPSKRRSSR